ncbi:MAG: orotidine-5'-phosphate decarboxylase [Clostridiales bacterium]|jgi:orotidine-5'-phosphate decarboxylase|nr:orotidine-5'-phosphate decarboxylase [Clostridiales bacterium]
MTIDKLIEKMRKLRNPSVIGLDPRLDLIPEYILSRAKARYGETTKAAAEAIQYFNRGIIDAVSGIAPAVKPQIAFYEQYGAYGILSYIETVAYAKSKGMLVIGDIKRGDIASTADAYADAHLGLVKTWEMEHSVYGEDFVTINPYMGEDSIEPFLRNCREHKKGVFILVKTSNPGSGQIQDLPVINSNATDAIASASAGEPAPLYETVASLVSQWGEELIGQYGYSAVGAVVGATHPEQARRLRELMPHTLFLAPGYGAQGAKASDLVDGSLVNSSRGIIGAWKQPLYRNRYRPEEYDKAARAAALDMREELSCLKI